LPLLCAVRRPMFTLGELRTVVENRCTRRTAFLGWRGGDSSLNLYALVLKEF